MNRKIKAETPLKARMTYSNTKPYRISRLEDRQDKMEFESPDRLIGKYEKMKDKERSSNLTQSELRMIPSYMFSTPSKTSQSLSTSTPTRFNYIKGSSENVDSSYKPQSSRSSTYESEDTTRSDYRDMRRMLRQNQQREEDQAHYQENRCVCAQFLPWVVVVFFIAFLATGTNLLSFFQNEGAIYKVETEIVNSVEECWKTFKKLQCQLNESTGSKCKELEQCFNVKKEKDSGKEKQKEKNEKHQNHAMESQQSISFASWILMAVLLIAIAYLCARESTMQTIFRVVNAIFEIIYNILVIEREGRQA